MASSLAVSATPARAPAIGRLAFLDQIRGVLTLLVVLHHTAITYGGAGDWYYREATWKGGVASMLLTLFCAINQAYFMGAFWMPVGRELAHLQLRYFASYVVLFAIGCMAGRHRWLERSEWTYARPWWVVTLIALPVLPVAALAHDALTHTPVAVAGGVNGWALLYALWEPFVACGVLLALLWLFRTRVDATRLHALGRRAYAIYCFHPPRRRGGERCIARLGGTRTAQVRGRRDAVVRAPLRPRGMAAARAARRTGLLDAAQRKPRVSDASGQRQQVAVACGVRLRRRPLHMQQTRTSFVASPWTQLVIGIVCMTMIANLQYGWTLFVGPIDARHHWGRAAIQVAFTIFVLLETWLVPVEGYLVDRFGPRWVVVGGGALCAVAWTLNSVADSLALLYFAAALGGIGAGAVYGTSIGNAVKWFPRRRGLAAGLTAAGFGAGSALTVVPIATRSRSRATSRPSWYSDCCKASS